MMHQTFTTYSTSNHHSLATHRPPSITCTSSPQKPRLPPPPSSTRRTSHVIQCRSELNHHPIFPIYRPPDLIAALKQHGCRETASQMAARTPTSPISIPYPSHLYLLPLPISSRAESVLCMPFCCSCSCLIIVPDISDARWRTCTYCAS